MPTEELATARAAGAPTSPWRSYAYGLDLEADFETPGLPVSEARDRLAPRTRLQLVSPAAIEDAWPARGTERLLEERFDDSGPPARTIDAHPAAGYRLYARGFGLAHISREGGYVRCAPPDIEAWSWQRFLVGRVLPWAALLRGHEVFHASAVRVREQTIAIIGPSGAGKTSLAVRLVLGGARFVTDDVLALERRDGAVWGHPGTSIVAVRERERDAIPRAQWRRLGTVLGHSDKTYVELPRAPDPAPVRSIYFLAPSDGPAEPLLSEIDDLDPRRLLASTFVVSVRSTERLRNQLEVCSDLARTARLFVARVDRDAGAERLAAAIAAHATREAA